jgi:hypothetical protein
LPASAGISDAAKASIFSDNTKKIAIFYSKSCIAHGFHTILNIQDYFFSDAFGLPVQTGEHNHQYASSKPIIRII